MIMMNNNEYKKMFDRTNSFLISVNQVSKISNEEIVKRLVKRLLFCKLPIQRRLMLYTIILKT